MMKQFEVFRINGGHLALFRIETSRFDNYIGFRVFIKYL